MGLVVANSAFYLAYSLLFVRGFFVMKTKVARDVALKNFLDDEFVDRVNNVVISGNYVDQVLGAVVGFALVLVLSFTIIATVNAGTYIVSAFACALLPVAAAVRSDTGGYISLCKRWEKVVLSNKMIMHSMITLGLLVVFLQALIKSRASGSRWPGSTFHPSMDLFRKL